MFNKKRVHRLHRLDGLQVRMRVRRRKRLSLHRGPAPRTQSLGERWSMDFVHDQLADGRSFRVLTVLDNVTSPRSITVDHGTEFTSKALDQWAWENRVLLDFTRPGKPTDNGLCESFNGRLRDECLNLNEFLSIEHARQVIEAWRLDYNQRRPHGSLGHLTPNEFAATGRKASAGGSLLQV